MATRATRTAPFAPAFALVARGPGGQFLRIIRPEGQTVLTYNLDGAVTNISSPEGVIHYEYDPVMGWLIRAYTVNSDVRYAYDELGRLQTVTVMKRNGLAVSPPEETRHITPGWVVWKTCIFRMAHGRCISMMCKTV